MRAADFKRTSDCLIAMTSGPKASFSSKEWQNHEHVSEQTSQLAAQLLQKAGSPQLAKHAIDAATAAATSESELQWFAQTCGFESYQALKSAAIPIESLDSKRWLAVAQRGNGWIVWRDGEVSCRRYDSLETASAAAAMAGS